MNAVYRITIGWAVPEEPHRALPARSFHVVASSIVEAVQHGEAFLKHDYAAVPEQATDFTVTAVERLMLIDWPS